MRFIYLLLLNLLVRLPPRMLVKMEVHLDSKTKEQADGEQVSVGGCLIPVRWMQLGRLRCGLPQGPCSLSLSAYYLTRILCTSLPVPSSPPQFVSAGAFLQAPGPGSQLPPALLHRTTTPPFEFFFRVSRSSPLQHLSSIGTASADPAGLRLPPSLGGGKQALPYFGGLPFFCASNSAPKSVSLGWILKYAGCCDSCCCARGWLTSSSSSSVCVCVFRTAFFPDVLLNPRTLVPHVETCSATRGVAVALPSLLWSGRVIGHLVVVGQGSGSTKVQQRGCVICVPMC